MEISKQEFESILERLFYKNRVYIRDAYPEVATWRSWLEQAGSEDVALTGANDSEIYYSYLRGVGLEFGELLDMYIQGQLSTVAPRYQHERPTIESTPVDPRNLPWQPQERNLLSPEDAQSIYSLATQRAGANKPEIMAARKSLFLAFNTDPDLAGKIGIKVSELNKKIRNYSGLTSTRIGTQTRLNYGIPEEHSWQGITNASFLGQQSVTPEDIDQFVKSVTVKDDAKQTYYGSTGEAVRKQMAMVFLAIDTRIQYDDLSVEVTRLKPSAGRDSPSRGKYFPQEKTIRLDDLNQNTVSHELGHYLDHKFGEQFGASIRIYLSNPADTLRRSQQPPEQMKWAEKYRAFVKNLMSKGDIYSEYTQSPEETFARFVDKFVQWTSGQSRSFNDSRSDSFEESDFHVFVSLMQEKSFLDSKFPIRKEASSPMNKIAYDLETSDYEQVGLGNSQARAAIAWMYFNGELEFSEAGHIGILKDLASRLGEAIFEVSLTMWKGRMDFDQKVISADNQTSQSVFPPELIQELVNWYKTYSPGQEEPEAIINFSAGQPSLIWESGSFSMPDDQTLKELAASIRLPVYRQKFASEEYFPKDRAQEDFTALIGDTDRYTSDNYRIDALLRENVRGYSVAFRVYNEQLGVSGWVEYWHYKTSELKKARSTYRELEEVIRTITGEIEYQRPPMALIIPMFRLAVKHIDVLNKEKSGVYHYNWFNVDVPVVGDWRRTLYGKRYPGHVVRRIQENWNDDDPSRKIQVTGKGSRGKQYSFDYASSDKMIKTAVEGEWFIDDGGQSYFADGDIVDANHQYVAAEAMMGADYLEKFHEGTLTDEEIAEIEANEPGFYEYFWSEGDPRMWVIEKHNWIRVNGDARGTNFQVQTLDRNALERIADFLGEELWDEDRWAEYVYITENSTNRSLEVEARQFILAHEYPGAFERILLRLSNSEALTKDAGWQEWIGEENTQKVKAIVDKTFWATLGFGAGAITSFLLWYAPQNIGAVPQTDDEMNQVAEVARADPQIKEKAQQFLDNAPTIGKLPRGIRNNNPGNIELGDDAWQGMLPEQVDKRFIQFESPEYGIRALAKLLRNYESRYGINTITGIISRWAPTGENNTRAYIQQVSKQTGFAPDEVLNLNSSDHLFRLVQAIIHHENGMSYYDDETIYRGIELAFEKEGSLVDAVQKHGMNWFAVSKELVDSGMSRDKIASVSDSFLSSFNMFRKTAQKCVQSN